VAGAAGMGGTTKWCIHGRDDGVVAGVGTCACNTVHLTKHFLMVLGGISLQHVHVSITPLAVRINAVIRNDRL
jgi:hypothetical protein